MSGTQSPAAVRAGGGEAGSGTVTAAELGPRAARTRDRILAASRELFLKHGYAGTRIAQITAECGISRAGFYTYFRDKQEIFNALGVAAYRAVLNQIAAWDDLPSPAGREDIATWVAGYFAIMDEHGPFIFSAAQSAPTDEQTQADAHRMQMPLGLGPGHPAAGPPACPHRHSGHARARGARPARPLLVLQPLSEPAGQRQRHGAHRRRLARRCPWLAERVVRRLRQGEDFRSVLRAQEARGDRGVE